MQGPSSAVDELFGRRFGPYVLGDKIGGGSVAQVHRAEDSVTGSSLAIKVARRPPGDPARDRILQEAMALKLLEHPSIARFYDAGSDGDLVWVAMELIDGPTLFALLGGGPLPWPVALAIARHVIGGLAYAHARGVMHRDIKPTNVMIDRAGAVKLVDFGLAKQLDPDPSGEITHVEWAHVRTTLGAVLGTPSYMAPEQARGERVDARADVFALGVLLYEMLTGKSPFRRASAALSIHAVLNDVVPPVTSLAPDVPHVLAAFVARALSRDPEARPRDAQVLLEELETTVREPLAMAMSVALSDEILGRVGARASIPPRSRFQSEPPSAPRAEPTQAVPCIGREDELIHLSVLLERGARLVSVWGPSGVGKTMLVRELALRERELPTAWVNVDGTVDVEIFRHRLAAALGIVALEPDRELLTRRLVRRGPLRLVVDGERRGELDGFLEDLLSVDSLRIVLVSEKQLASSRIHVPVGGLAPKHAHRLAFARLGKHELARTGDAELFQAASTPEYAESSEIAQLLAGHPLAIGIAAARARAMGAANLLRLLRDRAESRGRSLENALAIALDTLDPKTVHAIMVLSACETFDRRAATMLLEISPRRTIDLPSLLGSLEKLGALETLPARGAWDVDHYRLPGPLLRHARRELAGSSIEPRQLVRHATYFVNAAAHDLRARRDEPGREPLRALFEERANHLAIGRRAKTPIVPEYKNFGLFVCAAASIAAEGRTLDREHVPMLRALLADPQPSHEPSTRVIALRALALAEVAPELRFERLREALAVADAHGLMHERAEIMVLRAELEEARSALAPALADALAATELARRLSLPHVVLRGMLLEARLRARRGERTIASAVLADAHAIASSSNDLEALARIAFELALGATSPIEQTLGLERALELANARALDGLAADVELELAAYELAQGAIAPASARAARAAQRARNAGAATHQAQARAASAFLDVARNEERRARHTLEDAAQGFAELGDIEGRAVALAGLVMLARRRREPGGAADELASIVPTPRIAAMLAPYLGSSRPGATHVAGSPMVIPTHFAPAGGHVPGWLRIAGAVLERARAM